MMLLNRKLGALAAGVAALLVVVGLASPADATQKNGVLELGEFGLYLGTGSTGTVFDLYFSDSDFNNDVFPGTSIPAANNTESYRNRDTLWWHVFTESGYTGSHGCLPAGWVGDASATYKNNIESAYFSSSGC
jgi:peptidase inhibitor family I36